MRITVYSAEYQSRVIDFMHVVFAENSRTLDIEGKDRDIAQIDQSYMVHGKFWLLIDSNGQVHGTIAIRKLHDCFEIRRFFIDGANKGQKHGEALLYAALDYAMSNRIKVLRAATMRNGVEARHLFLKYGFEKCPKYNNSTAELFFEKVLNRQAEYDIKLTHIKTKFNQTLILNPTENVPFEVYNSAESMFLEGLYVSDQHKGINDKVIFAGRNEYIDFVSFIKDIWNERLHSADVDLKSLAGLNAHLLLFLCTLRPDEKVMILPEICGGHFATQSILEHIGVHPFEMVADNKNFCVDQDATLEVIRENGIDYVFVDRSEGLYYEDFSWLSNCDAYKIFDASQYLTSILCGDFPNPFDWGFDMIVSTLHKNYPGPQKGIFAVKRKDDDVWERYNKHAKTFISNTHPKAIMDSVRPQLDLKWLVAYNEKAAKCISALERGLYEEKVPVVRRESKLIPTQHIWIKCPTQELSYEYYLDLESAGLLTNYRLLPYNLGFGLRIGLSAAILSGLNESHIEELVDIMSNIYKEGLSDSLEKQSQLFIKKVKLIEG